MKCYFCLHKNSDSTADPCKSCQNSSNYEPKDHARHVKIIQHKEGDWF